MSTKLINNEINRIRSPITIIQKQVDKNPQEIKKQQKNVGELHESPNEILKNYLTPIVIYADLLSQETLGKLSKPQKEKIELIKEQTHKIINYLDGLKIEDVSQLEFPKHSEQVQKFILQRK